MGEYLHHAGESFKYKIFENGELEPASIPMSMNFLRICQNPAGLDEEILYLLADQIEAHHRQGSIGSGW